MSLVVLNINLETLKKSSGHQCEDEDQSWVPPPETATGIGRWEALLLLAVLLLLLLHKKNIFKKSVFFFFVRQGKDNRC